MFPGPNKHQSAVTCLQFNSKFVITSSDDGTVKLWDVKTGKTLIMINISSICLSFFKPFSNILGEFIRDLVALESGGSGGVVWRIRSNATKLVCAVGSRNGTEETKLLVLDFDVHDSKWISECQILFSWARDLQALITSHSRIVSHFCSKILFKNGGQKLIVIRYKNSCLKSTWNVFIHTKKSIKYKKRRRRRKNNQKPSKKWSKAEF